MHDTGPWMAGLTDAPDGIDEFDGDRFLHSGGQVANAFLEAHANAH